MGLLGLFRWKLYIVGCAVVTSQWQFKSSSVRWSQQRGLCADTLCCAVCCCAVAASCLQHSIGINLTVQCPKSMVGRVIGKGGETIKNLQRKYHTSIQVGSQVRITTLGPGYREVVVCALNSCWLAQADG